MALQARAAARAKAAEEHLFANGSFPPLLTGRGLSAQLRRQLQPGDLETGLRWWPPCGKLSPEPGDAAAAGHAQEYCSLAALNSYLLPVDGGALLQALEAVLVVVVVVEAAVEAVRRREEQMY